MKNYYDDFRQSYETVKTRMSRYLRYFSDSNSVVDLACGRGEFLEILKENNIRSVGVDNDPDMIRRCRDKGFEIIQDDILEFLRKGEKFDGIIASHIIEHLNGEAAEKLLALCFDALNPGGRILLITPNSENISVISKTFWLDLTHIRLYPLILLEKMLAENGFSILESGGDNSTRREIKAENIRKKLASFFLRSMGIYEYWNYLNSPLDVFIVGEKR